MAKNKAIKELRKEASNMTPSGKTTKKTFSVKLGKEKFGLEGFCNYKAMLVLEILGELSEQVDLAPIVKALLLTQAGQEAGPIWGAVAVQLLPKALQKAPRTITRLAALSLIPNKKLAELYDAPNGIAEEMGRVGKLIDFQGEPGLPLAIITEALPYIGLDALKNGLTGLGEVLGASLSVDDQTPSIG